MGSMARPRVWLPSQAVSIMTYAKDACASKARTESPTEDAILYRSPRFGIDTHRLDEIRVLLVQALILPR